MQRQKAPFSVTNHADRCACLRVLMLKPVDGSENFLDLVSNDVPASLVRHSIDPLAMRLIRHANS